MKFDLESYHRNVSDDDLISDVKAVAKKTGKSTVTMREYNVIGKYHSKTLIRRFKSWFDILKMADLQPSRSGFNIPVEELFDNLRNVWVALGKQPRRAELKRPLSLFSGSVYEVRFGTWRKALEEFVVWVNDADDDAKTEDQTALSAPSAVETKPKQFIRKTKREISERLRFKILLRDGFTCQTCGSSPLKSRGVELHADHVIPWSKGGETVPENLMTKCSRCNLGKGNAFNA